VDPRIQIELDVENVQSGQGGVAVGDIDAFAAKRHLQAVSDFKAP
jgi:hypothetical protein